MTRTKKEIVTVIDFETANQNRNSACSIGIVQIEGNKIISQKEYLIKPVGYYSSRNTQIHGMCEQDTINAPTWDKIYPEIKHYFAGKVIAHSGFDKSVLEKLSSYYNLELPAEFAYIDTVQMARFELPELDNHQLATLAKHFKLGEFTHHNALADTVICAKIYIKLQIIKMSKTSDDYLETAEKLIMKGNEKLAREFFKKAIDSIKNSSEYRNVIECLMYVLKDKEWAREIAIKAKVSYDKEVNGLVSDYNCKCCNADSIIINQIKNKNTITSHIKIAIDALTELTQKVQDEYYSIEEFKEDISHSYLHINFAYNIKEETKFDEDNLSEKDFFKWIPFPKDIDFEKEQI